MEQLNTTNNCIQMNFFQDLLANNSGMVLVSDNAKSHYTPPPAQPKLPEIMADDSIDCHHLFSSSIPPPPPPPSGQDRWNTFPTITRQNSSLSLKIPQRKPDYMSDSSSTIAFDTDDDEETLSIATFNNGSFSSMSSSLCSDSVRRSGSSGSLSCTRSIGDRQAVKQTNAAVPHWIMGGR